jgi:hypothetical protein
VISLSIFSGLPIRFPDGPTCIPPDDSCTNVTRVHIASCMKNVGGMLLPCPGSACCFADYEVCKNPNGSPNVRRTNTAPSTPSCTHSGEIPIVTNPSGSGCYPVCEYLQF